MSIFYVSNSGNDNNDGLSLENAFKTISKAISSIVTEGTVLIDNGVYEIDSLVYLSSQNYTITIKSLSNDYNNIPIIKVKSSGAQFGTGSTTSIYDIIFMPADTFSGDSRVLGYHTDKATVKFYNCLFLANKTTHIPTAGFFLFATSGSAEANKYFYNCTFDNNNGTTLIGNNYAGMVHMYNCASSYDKSDDVATFTDCVKNVTYLDNHQIVGQDNSVYGIYSGKNAWTTLLCLLKSNNKYYSIKEEYYDTETKTYKELSSDQFSDGMFAISDLFREITVNDETFKPISKFTSFKICASKIASFMVNGLKSTSELIVGKSSFSTSFAENIDYFKLSGNKLDGVKLAVSIDEGLTWKTYDSETEAFKDLDITIPTSNYSDFSSSDIENWNTAKIKIDTDGINASSLNSIDFNKLNSTKIKFAYVLTAQSASEMDSMKKLAWQFDAKGLLRQCTPDEVTIEVNSNGVKITSKIDAEILKTNILYEEN